MIKFSVIIPTFNRAGKLRRALNSILNQTYSNYEIIIIDDGSTDETSTQFSNCNINSLRYIRIENSGGPATPRNVGIKEANGDWIAFLDSDDYWLPNKLEVISNEILNNNFDAICHNEIILDDSCHKNGINIYGPSTKNMYENLLYCGNRLSTSATVVNTSFVRKNSIKFDEDSKYLMVEDYDYWLSIAYKKGNFKFINDVLGVYEVSSDSLTKNCKLNQINLNNVIEKHLNATENIEYLDAIREFRKIKGTGYRGDRRIKIVTKFYKKFIFYKICRYLQILIYHYEKIFKSTCYIDNRNTLGNHSSNLQ